MKLGIYTAAFGSELPGVLFVTRRGEVNGRFYEQQILVDESDRTASNQWRRRVARRLRLGAECFEEEQREVIDSNHISE